ncbi:MobC family plasmid mobilization relaxosome protein [Christensenellaceae bacterium OttesenSCG-928-K19]|nr:MobC family plasmid mobilization relaxosome protein [Christensenellaceae bacterium OttesenSCG-928-K19]
MSHRKRGVLLSAWVSAEEYNTVMQRMEEAGTQNASAYIRKMTLNGYVLNVDISPVRELVSLLRRCSNNLNQVAKHANTYGIYEHEVKGLQKDYEKLWGRVSDVLNQLAAVVAL